MWRTILLIALGIIGVLAGWGLASRSASTPGIDLAHGVALEQPRAIADFSLIDQFGKPFTVENLQGEWSLLFIGFTHCPDICPMTLTQIGVIQAAVQARGHALQGVFVSVDPERDSPEELRTYLEFFDADFIGVSGERSALNRLCDDLDFGFVKVPRSAGDYTIDHSGALALIGPDANLVGYFIPPLDPDEIVADLVRIL